MAKLTVTIDDEVLTRARTRALAEGGSVNALVRAYLERYAGLDADGAMEEFLEITATAGATSGPGGPRWTRDELHER